MRLKRLLLLLLLLLALSPYPSAEAAVKGIALSPALKELSLGKDQTSVEFAMQLSNTTDATVELRLSTLDFGALDESGGIAFLGRTGQETTAYGLKQWMVPEKDRLTLEPGQSQEVKITVENKESLSPGGHYGAIIVTSANEEQGGKDNVAVLPAASTLVFLKKLGGEVLKLNIDSVKANSSWVNVPKQATLRFHNSGNTHLIPRGTVELQTPTGSVIARGVVNTDSSYVLPESFRQFSIDLQRYKEPWLPGRYKLVTTWRYEGTDEVSTEVQYHWYFGKIVLFSLLIICLVIVLILYINIRKRAPTRN